MTIICPLTTYITFDITNPTLSIYIYYVVNNYINSMCCFKKF